MINQSEPEGSTMRKLRLDDQLCFALYSATNAVTRAYRPLLAEIDLTYPQYLLMLALWQDGTASIRQIADRLQLGQNALTPLLDRLAEAGLITRRRDAVDRRVIFIELTQVGRDLEQGAALAQEAVVCRTGLSPTDLADLRENLLQLTDRIVLGNDVSKKSVSSD